MEPFREQHQAANVSAEQSTSNELVKLIRKLRWIGMQEEAAAVQRQLSQRSAAPADSVSATPHDTD